MSADDDTPIWYACYGSNCLAARFEVYLTGGTAPGADRAEPGARDPRPPRHSAPYWFPSAVRFAGNTTKWGGGGVAFLDHPGADAAPPRDPRGAAGRRYLITKGQFDDVVAQESRRDRRSLSVADAPIGTVHAAGEAWYDGLLRLPAIDGIPVATFTSPRPLHDRPTNAPAPRYLSTIVKGLAEVHPLTIEALADHLMGAPGIADGWTAPEIAALAAENDHNDADTPRE